MRKLLILFLMSLTALPMMQCVKDKDNHGSFIPPADTAASTEYDEYVDLGLISMTLWKAYNEKNEADAKYDYFTYDEAVATFRNNLPTMEQFQELMHSCRWVWSSLGIYKVFGPNGN